MRVSLGLDGHAISPGGRGCKGSAREAKPCYAGSVTELLILIAGVALLILALGLPLLLRKDSLVPDMIGLGVLAVAILAYVWTFGIWWTLLPVVAIFALVAWMDRKGGEKPHPETGMSDRTRLRFRLWAAANGLSIIPLALVILAMATRIGAGSVKEVLLPMLLVMLAASSAFRFSYNRSIPIGAPVTSDPPPRAS